MDTIVIYRDFHSCIVKMCTGVYNIGLFTCSICSQRILSFIHSFIHFVWPDPFIEHSIYCLQCRRLHPEIVGHKFPCVLAAATTAVDRASFTSSFMARCWPSFISRNIAYTKFQAKDHTTISLAHL